MRTLSFTNLPDYVAAGDYYVLLEWPSGGFAQFHVPAGSNIFEQRANNAIAVNEETPLPVMICSGICV